MDLAYYLLKLVICSGILYLYYLVALRNKLFHQWNRFYLLISVMISLTVPLLHFTIWKQATEQPNQAIEILTVVGSANNYLDEVTITSQSSVSTAEWIIYAYGLVSLVLLAVLSISLIRIFYIVKTHSVWYLDRIKFVNTRVKGTPFSFLQFIFWNQEIDLQSETGQQIFKHELVHVKEKHTIDKLFMQLLMIVFWCNPFFWLIRKELRLIHEFIADKKSIAEHGTAALAAMILQSAYPNHFNSITNQFFQTSIKRRLRMLTKIQNPGINYISRVIALPIIAITVLAFTLRTRHAAVPPVLLEKEFVVVIDAAHGKMADGKYNGARSGDVYEDNIVLAIAQKIKELNKNANIKIIFTRPTEEITDLKRRVEIANENKADLFVSIHANAHPNSSDSSGMEVWVSNKNSFSQQQSELFGSILQEEMSKLYNTTPYLKRRQVGIWVLDKTICPSAIIECGYITNEKDRQFITNEENQKAVAQKILVAIQRYAVAKETSFNSVTDTIPANIKSISIDKNKNQITVEYKDGKQEILSEQEATKAGLISEKKLTVSDPIDKHRISHLGTATPLYVQNGKIFDGDVDQIDPNTIRDVHVLKGDAAVTKYGEKGKNGVIEITTSPKSKTVQDTIPKVVFSKTEVEASADRDEWKRFLEKNTQPVIVQAASKGAPPGLYTIHVKFIVHTDGHLSNFVILKDLGFGLGDGVLEAMKNAPKWKPAMQNGRPVNSYHTQPISFVITDDKNLSGANKAPDILGFVKSADLHALLQLNKDDEIVSFSMAIDNDDNDIVEITTPSGENAKSFLEKNAKAGKMLTIDRIQVKRDGVLTKVRSVGYRL